MSKITNEQIEYAQQVLMEQLKADAGRYVAQEMVKNKAADGDAMATIFGSLMKDSALEPNCYALSLAIHILGEYKK